MWRIKGLNYILAHRFCRLLSTNLPPPSHFSNPGEIPNTYNSKTTLIDQHQTSPVSSQNSQTPSTLPPPTSSDRSSPLKEITTLLAMGTLGYLAIDNYLNRVKLEKLANETTAINLKALQIQQTNFLNARKVRDLQVLQERRDYAKRDFKMGLHIAILRQQLADLGVEPIDIETAIKEFEKNVRADNSVKNVSGQTLWLVDNSRTYN